MKKKRAHTQRGVKYDALAKGYRILNSPLADTFSAAAEHFSETDAPIDEGERKIQSNVKVLYGVSLLPFL
jgi:hypothetical protein